MRSCLLSNCLSLALVFSEATSETDKVDSLISAWEEKVLLLYIDSVLKVHRYLQRNATGFYLVYTRLVFLKCHKDKGFWATASVFILSDSFLC